MGDTGEVGAHSEALKVPDQRTLASPAAYSGHSALPALAILAYHSANVYFVYNYAPKVLFGYCDRNSVTQANQSWLRTLQVCRIFQALLPTVLRYNKQNNICAAGFDPQGPATCLEQRLPMARQSLCLVSTNRPVGLGDWTNRSSRQQLLG